MWETCNCVFCSQRKVLRSTVFQKDSDLLVKAASRYLLLGQTEDWADFKTVLCLSIEND